MRSFAIIFLLIFLLADDGYSQNTATDSLWHLLSIAKEDTSRALLLGRIASTYVYSKPDSALRIVQQGLILSRKIKFHKAEGNCLNIIGLVFQTTGNYPKALEMFLQSLKIRESIHDERGIGGSYNNIGSIYNNQGDYIQCLKFSFKGKEIAETIHSDRPLLISLLNIGNAYEKLNQLDSARLYTQQAYELAVRLNNVDGRGFSLNVLGNIHSKMGQIKLAMEYYRLSIPDLVAENDNDATCEANLGMADLFRRSGLTDSALQYARRSLEAAKKGGFTNRLLNASSFLSSYYKSIHIVDSAYAYQEVTIAAKDSLFSQEKTREVQNLSFMEQIRQQEIADAAAQAKEERKRNLQIAGIAAFIPLFFGVVILLRKRRTKTRTIEFMGILGLLLLFEFITLIIHPYIEEWTHHTPVLMFLILVGIAAILTPLHHRLEHWMKKKLVQKPYHTVKPISVLADS